MMRSMRAWFVFATGAACLAPWLFPSSAALTLLCQIGIAIVVCQSYQLLLEQGGMLSFGHAIYVGAGTFAGVQSLKLVGAGLLWLPASLVPLLGGLMGLCLAAVLGWFTTRRAGTALAMISLGLCELVWACALMWPQISGGEAGLSANRVVGPRMLGLDLASPLQMYGLIAFYALGCTALLAWFVRTPLGHLLRATRDNPERVAFLGYDPHHVRYLAFMLAGFLAGIAGGLAALSHEIFTTDMLSAERSASYLLFTVLGGSHLFLGPLLGGLLMVMCLSLLSAYTSAWLLYVGLLFMAVVLFMPGGLAHGLRLTLRHVGQPMPWRRRITALAMTLSLVWAAWGAVMLIEMGYHLPQVTVTGATLNRFGLTWSVDSPANWALAGLVLLSGGVFFARLRRPSP